MNNLKKNKLKKSPTKIRTTEKSQNDDKEIEVIFKKVKLSKEFLKSVRSK